MTIDPWVLASFVCKILLYISAAMVLGGLFSRFFFFAAPFYHCFPFSRYIGFFAALGLLSSLAGYFIQAGAFADTGISGIVDSDMLRLLAATSIGSATGAQVAGFSLTVLTAFTPARQLVKNLLIVLALIGALSLLVSFTQIGHLVDQGYTARAVVPLHVLMVSLWLGSLLPLWSLSRSGDEPSVRKLMVRFSRAASIIVALLLGSGLYLATTLLRDWRELFGTAYGVGLLCKLGFVFLLLSLAAYNKWILVPALSSGSHRKRLTISIVCEMVIGFIILGITAALTTLIGHHPSS